MGLIKTNGNQFSETNDAEYAAMLQEDFQNLKERKTELGTKLGFS